MLIAFFQATLCVSDSPQNITMLPFIDYIYYFHLDGDETIIIIDGRTGTS